MSFDPHASVYATGRAVGSPNIRDDTMTFRFEDETWTVPMLKLPPPSTLFNGYFYTIPIEQLREIVKEK